MSAAALFPPGLFKEEQTKALIKAFAAVDATEADNFAQMGVATTTTFILCCMGMVRKAGGGDVWVVGIVPTHDTRCVPTRTVTLPPDKTPLAGVHHAAGVRHVVWWV